MSVLPSKLADRVLFVEKHIDIWTQNVALINLSLPEITAMETAAAACRAALQAQAEAQDAAKAATLNVHLLGDAMTALVSDAIKAIKLHASQTNDPNVYVLANIPAPQPATPAGPPKAPTALVADPNADGTVSLKWKGSVANQTFFGLQRRLDNGPWVALGAIATKTFLDTTIPSPAPTAVYYRVFSQRQNLVSEPSSLAGVYYGGGDAGSAMTNIAGFLGGEGPQSEAA